MSDGVSSDQAGAVATSTPEAQPSGPASGTVERQRRPKANRVREIDFSRPTKFTQEQQRRIARAHEGFCRSASLRLTSELRTETELEVINLAQLTLSGAYSELPAQTLFGIVQCMPLGTSILLAVELKAVTGMIERLLGGVPSQHGIERELTEIELALARRALASIVEELSIAWEELFHVTLELTMVETQVQNLQLAPPSEPTVALTIELGGDELSATMSVVVPFRAIESVVHLLAGAQIEADPDTAEDEEAARAVLATVQAVEVELRVEVACVDIALGQLLELRPGDVVSLGSPAAQGVTVFAASCPVLRAKPGRRGRVRAIEIVDQLGGRSA